MQCFCGLDLIPVAQHAIGRICDGNVDIGLIPRRPRSLVSKYVGMATNQFAIQMIKHIGNSKVAFVGRHLRVKENLKK